MPFSHQRHRATGTWAVILLWILPAMVHTASLYTVTLPPYEEECFLLRTGDFKKQWRMSGNYELMGEKVKSTSTSNGDNEPLLVYVMDGKLQKTLFHSTKGRASGSFSFEVEAKTSYWLCLENSNRHVSEDQGKHPDGVTRQVGFTYNLVPENIPLTAWSSQKTKDWMDASRGMERQLYAMKSHQEYLKMREADHRTLVERTFADVLKWTLIEAVGVCLVAAGQVFILRRYLEKPRYY